MCDSRAKVSAYAFLNLYLNRVKVDMTKYTEEHNFNFDNVYDSSADNNIVSDIIILNRNSD
jgi:hypothetical protein